jgi:hypothetical protein
MQCRRPLVQITPRPPGRHKLEDGRQIVPMRPHIGLGIHAILPGSIGVFEQTTVAVVAGLEVDGARGELLGFGAWRGGLLPGEGAHGLLGGRACGAGGGVLVFAVETGGGGAHFGACAGLMSWGFGVVIGCGFVLVGLGGFFRVGWWRWIVRGRHFLVLYRCLEFSDA